MIYEYCPKIEAAARAIALPAGREWQYWVMTVAAIAAYTEAPQWTD